MAELGELRKMSDALGDKGLVLIGMNADGLSEKEFAEKLAESPVNWRQGMLGDGDHPIYQDYEIVGFPTKVVIDRSGKIAAIDPDNLEACVESLLGEE